jgi:plastocyanin
MRRLSLWITAAAALVFAAPAATTPAATVSVQIRRAGFAPARVTINAGDAVTWRNADTVNHQVVANGGSFVSPILKPREAYTHTFGSGGTYRYHDGLRPTLTGTVVVRGAPPQVTLAASMPLVRYGSQVTLTGAVSNRRSGQTVTLVALPYGQTNKQVIATLQTGTNGTFSFGVTPQIYTTYQAQWRSLESSVIVQVQPTIKLPTVSRTGYFHFYVTAGQSFAGRYAYLQRFTLSHTWVNLRRLQLGSKSGRIISMRSVRSLIPRGRWSIRVFMPAAEMPGGYADAASGTQPVVKR